MSWLLDGLRRLIAAQPPALVGVLALSLMAACESETGTAATDPVDEELSSDALPTDAGDAEPTTEVLDDPADLTPDEAVEVVPDGWQPPLSFCSDDVCAAGPEQAPDPTARGPFTVGVRTELLEYVDSDGDERILKTEIWYPGVPGTGETTQYVYDLIAEAPPEADELLEGVTVNPLAADAYAGMSLDSEHGPYPVVFFSHGAYGVRFQSVFFTIHLASHGYIVVAPDHTDETLYDALVDGYDQVTLVNSAIQRGEDANFVVDHFVERDLQPDDFFFEAIDEDNMGFSGHSFGALITLYEGGSNPHIRAAVPFAPATSLLALGGVEARYFPVPFMMHGGLMDETLSYEDEMLSFYNDAPPPKYLVELQRGGHYTYTDICLLDLSRLAGEVGFDDGVDALSDGCHEDNIPFEEGQEIINTFSIGFLNYYLRRSPDSAQYFSAEAAAEYSDELRFEALESDD